MEKEILQPKNINNEFVIKLDNYTIRGRSVGGYETCFIIDELSVAFDVGYQADKIENIHNIFISHAHIDHIGCLQYCYYNRQLHKITAKWRITMPDQYIKPFKLLAATVSSLSRGGYPKGYFNCNFLDKDNNITESTKTIKPFEELRVDELIEAEKCQDMLLINKTNMFVNAFEMNHKIKSFGYIIYEKRNKLKKEYLGLTGKEIKQLRDNKVDINDILTIPTIAFTGDTQIDAILKNKDFLESNILIMECTHFADSTIKNAIDHGHVHFDQFLDNISLFKNKWIILCHLSQKYRRIEDIQVYLEKIPKDVRNRIVVWI